MDLIINVFEYIFELISDIDFSDIYGIFTNIIDVIGKLS